jgi:hypothetical protein
VNLLLKLNCIKLMLKSWNRILSEKMVISPLRNYFNFVFFFAFNQIIYIALFVIVFNLTQVIEFCQMHFYMFLFRQKFGQFR